METKKRFFANHAKSSAVAATLLLHAGLIAVALTAVAITVVIKPEQTFETKAIKRPTMKLRKLQVPVKERMKTQAPKLRKTIIAKPRTRTMNIKMPEIVGVKGGMGYGSGRGLAGLGLGFDFPDLFGANKRGNGNEFVGHFYDLKQTKDGNPTKIGQLLAQAKSGDWMTDPDLIESSRLYREVVQHFLSSWNPNTLRNYFMAPREKFATTFMIPQIDASEAPKAFGVEGQVKPMKWLALYQGQIVAPETGRYRFCGRGDDVLVVRVKKGLVLDASYMNASDWQSSDPNSSKYEIYGSDNPMLKGMVIGDWIYLQKGRPVPMEVLLGEDPGGSFYCQLYVEQDGVKYSTRPETYIDSDTQKSETLQRPVLPVFKTARILDKVAGQMKINSNWATIEGPDFGIVK